MKFDKLFTVSSNCVNQNNFMRSISWDWYPSPVLDSRDPSSSQEHGIWLKAKQQGVQVAVTSRVPEYSTSTSWKFRNLINELYCNFWKALAVLWKPNLYRKHTQSSLFTSKNNVLMPAIKEKSPIIYASLTFIFTKKKKSFITKAFLQWPFYYLVFVDNSAFLRTQN